MTAKRVILEMGSGNDLHGGDYTKAAIRAVQDALHHSSLTFIRTLGLDSRKMQVQVTIGVQRPDRVDPAAVKSALPHGEVTVAGGQGRARRARRRVGRHRGHRQRRRRRANGAAAGRELRRRSTRGRSASGRANRMALSGLQVAAFSPTIPATMSPIKPRRAAVAGSPKRAMPRSAVPTVPMPVQTA